MRPDVLVLPQDEEALARRMARRRALFDRSLLADVARLFDDVAARGDQAVREATARHDGAQVAELRLGPDRMDACVAAMAAELRGAVDLAIRHVEEVNRALMPPPTWEREIRPGTLVGERATPLEAVGLWVPARKAPLVSTAVMLAAAARVAGVPRIVVAMPPRADGSPDPATVAAARLAGAGEAVVGNGVGTIAALALGTESVPEVDGIFGPGPGAIAAAMATAFAYGKRTTMGIGPSDGMVLADASASPARVARDLVNEAEHGPDSAAVLVTTSGPLAERTAEELAAAIAEAAAPRRGFLEAVFGSEGRGALAVAPDLETACQVVDRFAPEHLMIACERHAAREALARIHHAGEILLGHHTPFSAANYAIGITAVLPTNGLARVFSGVTCRDMLKHSTLASLDPEALAALWPAIRALGEHEGLPGHVAAARTRVEERGGGAG
ncbi:MAG: histidinol dehydrogenase [Candidatus Brocadiia bacterium]